MSTTAPTGSDVLVETPHGRTRRAHVVSAEPIGDITGVDERLRVNIDGVELTVLASECEVL
ncbi:hypothetical protein [Haloferax volcanii]|uniref:hypothetical protein n=1 Tax=Haloferax volcanii TaxID=2246 RepID=UPI00249AD3AA|nr:hypothetical protein [Haloferax alexandrinus]